MFEKLFNFWKKTCKPARYTLVLSIINLAMMIYLAMKMSLNKFRIFSWLLPTLFGLVVVLANFFLQDWFCKLGVQWVVWLAVAHQVFIGLQRFYFLYTYISANEENKKKIQSEMRDLANKQVKKGDLQGLLTIAKNI
jgi:hypothetical protein